MKKKRLCEDMQPLFMLPPPDPTGIILHLNERLKAIHRDEGDERDKGQGNTFKLLVYPQSRVWFCSYPCIPFIPCQTSCLSRWQVPSSLRGDPGIPVKRFACHGVFASSRLCVRRFLSPASPSSLLNVLSGLRFAKSNPSFAKSDSRFAKSDPVFA